MKDIIPEEVSCPAMRKVKSFKRAVNAVDNGMSEG
jgi:hypothetical protein